MLAAVGETQGLRMLQGLQEWSMAFSNLSRTDRHNWILQCKGGSGLLSPPISRIWLKNDCRDYGFVMNQNGKFAFFELKFCS